VKKRSVNWDDLLTLAVLSRVGSYSAAARELGLTHATIGRRMQRLEECAGAAIVTRRDGGFELTKAGRKALQAAEEMERIASGLGRNLEADADHLSGKVRITATEALGTYFILPRLAPFHQRHPSLTIELVLDNRTLSLSRRKADIAIRLTRPDEEGIVAKRLGAVAYGLYIRRDHPHADRLAGPSGAPLPICRLDKALAELPESLWLERHFPEAHDAFVSNSLVALYQAVMTGWGAALLPSFLASGNRDLACLTSQPAVSREIWLAYPGEYRNTPRCRAVIDWLVSIVNEAEAQLQAHRQG
jgi:molybdate transport repressor ModE-like protein